MRPSWTASTELAISIRCRGFRVGVGADFGELHRGVFRLAVAGAEGSGSGPLAQRDEVRPALLAVFLHAGAAVEGASERVHLVAAGPDRQRQVDRLRCDCSAGTVPQAARSRHGSHLRLAARAHRRRR
jgi:hypothetical protein